MHNLFLRITKHMVKNIWLKNGLISQNDMDRIHNFTNREPGLVQVVIQEKNRVTLGLKLYLVDQTSVLAEVYTDDGQDMQSADVTSELRAM